MSTASPATGKRNYVDFDEYIDFQLSRTRTNIKTTDILTALAGVGTLFLAYLLVFVVFDHWIVDGGFGTAARWLMLGGLLVACTAWVIWRVVLPYRRNVTGLYAAKAIESTEPDLQYSLLNLVDLKRAGRPVPPEIERALQKRAALTLHKGDVDAAVDRRPLMRLSYALLALVVICCLYAVLSPKRISASVWRALFPASQTAVDTAIKIDRVAVVHKGQTHEPDISVAAGTRLKVIADLDFTGEPPEAVTLYFSTQDRKFQDVAVPMKLDPEINKRYFARLEGGFGKGIRQNTSYRIVAGDAKAGPFEITIVRPPVATVRSVRYVYPKYMQREPRTQDGGHIEAWEGTDVAVNALTDQPVNKAWLVFTKTEDAARKPVHKVAMNVADGTKLSVTLTNEITLCEGSHPHFYHIECVGQSGFKDPDPAIYGVTIRQDRKPRIQLLDPEKNEIELPANTPLLPVLFKAEDDFAVRFVTLKYAITRKGEKTGRELPEPAFDGREKSVQKSHEWRLAHHQFRPGDSVKFHLHVRDNMPPRTRKAPWCKGGKQSLNESESRSVVVRFTEKRDPDDVDRQVQQRRQQHKQRQDEHEQNRGDRNPRQKQDQARQGDDKKDDQHQDGQKKKQGSKKGKTKTEKKGGGKTGNPQPDKQGTQQNQNTGAGNKADPRKSGSGERPPMNNQERLENLLKEQQKRDREKRKQEQSQPKNGTPKKSDSRKQNSQDQKPPNQKQPGAGNKTQQGAPKKSPNGMGKNGMNDDGKKQQIAPKQKSAGGNDTKQTKKPAGGSAKKKEMGNGGKKKSNADGGGNSDGMQSDADQTNGMTKQPGKKSNSKPKTAEKSKRQGKSNSEGPEKAIKDDGKQATRKQAKGNETGPTTPEKDPKANPTKAKDPKKLQKDTTKQPAKRSRNGTEEPDGRNKKVGSKKPGSAKPKPKTQENPVDQSTKPDGDPSKQKSKSPNKTNDAGNQPPSGMGRKNGQKSEMSDGGENGDTTPRNQGTKGSKQQGSGDMTNKPGARQTGNKQTGKPGQDPGMGSAKKPGQGDKPGGAKSGGKPKTGGKSSGSKGSGGQAGDNPGTGSAVPGNGDLKGKTPGKAPGAGQQPGKGDYTPPTPEERDKADLEYGREAANLVLDKLEDKVRRGEIDEKWLKQHNFKSKEEAIKFAKQQRERFNNKSLDSQTQEFLKSIRYRDFQKSLRKRTGENVRKQDVPGVGTDDKEDIPPHLRRYYNAFRRSVSK